MLRAWGVGGGDCYIGWADGGVSIRWNCWPRGYGSQYFARWVVEVMDERTMLPESRRVCI